MASGSGFSSERIKVRVGLSFSSAFKQPDGLFIELIETVFARMPQYQLVYLPPYTLARSIKLLKQHDVDAIVNITPNLNVEGCISEPIFSYHNIIVTYKFHLTKLEDLDGLRIAAFKNSREVLGTKYADVVKNAGLYHELTKQQNQARLLVEGRIDVSVGDLLIFMNSLEQFNLSKDPQLNVAASSLNYYQFRAANISSIAFIDATTCSAFNNALIALKQEGIYQQIIDRHYDHLGMRKITKIK